MATEHQKGKGKDPTYWLGRDASETQRLIRQGRLLNPFTRTVLREAGVSEGMRVLDVGSGAGDVALIAAGLVGPEGSVVGVDANPEVLGVARSRAGSTGLTNVAFVAGDCRSVDLEDGFDAVVGRLVLLYVADPVGMLQTLVERIRPGGIVAFQDYNFTPGSIQSYPPLPIWQTFSGWVRAAARQAGLSLAMGYELRRIYLETGLPEPRMQLDSPVGGGPDWEGYDNAASTFRSLLPLVLSSGIATAEEVAIETLAERMRAETVVSGGVVKWPDLVSAWTRKP
jgi:SAM-dependent methyltransferase